MDGKPICDFDVEFRLFLLIESEVFFSGFNADFQANKWPCERMTKKEGKREREKEYMPAVDVIELFLEEI